MLCFAYYIPFYIVNKCLALLCYLSNYKGEAAGPATATASFLDLDNDLSQLLTKKTLPIFYIPVGTTFKVIGCVFLYKNKFLACLLVSDEKLQKMYILIKVFQLAM